MLFERRWYGSLVSRWDRLKESYWLVPGLMCIGAVLLAGGALRAESTAAAGWVARVPLLSHLGSEGARAVLSATASSTITVAGVAFSITIVALTLASSQFGPRLLRGFMRDRANQLVLGTFLANFLYSLVVLGGMSSADRVPVLAVGGSVALTAASVFVLIFFIHHVTQAIQAPNVIASVAREIDAQLPQLFPESLGRGGDESGLDASRQQIEADGFEIAARCDGYVRVIDTEALLSIATESDLLLRLECTPGDFVTAGSCLLTVAPGGRESDELKTGLHDCVVLGDQRTAVQDLGFLTGQLVEMALRALSPGVNDPRTAISCVHRLGAVIAALAGREFPSAVRKDADGTARVLVEPARFDAIVDDCLSAIRRCGGSNPDLARATIEALATAADAACAPDRRAVLRLHADETLRVLRTSEGVPDRDVAGIERLHAACRSRFETTEDAPRSRRSAG